MVVYSRNMRGLKKTLHNFCALKTESDKNKVIHNFSRLAIFLEQTTIIIIFTLQGGWNTPDISGQKSCPGYSHSVRGIPVRSIPTPCIY